jgi:hypothetical protein
MRASLLRAPLLGAALVVLIAAPVLAARPDRQFLQAPTDIFLPAGIGACAFDVNLHVDVNQEYVTIWTDPAGSLLMFVVNGNLQLTATNLSTGASVSINASGPGRATFDAQGNPTVNVAEGHYLNFTPLTLMIGLLDFNTGALKGRSTDLCAQLS